MSPDIIDLGLAPLRRHRDVRASVQDAFDVFTVIMDSWWSGRSRTSGDINKTSRSPVKLRYAFVQAAEE